jgi:hypothetical protein
LACSISNGSKARVSYPGIVLASPTHPYASPSVLDFLVSPLTQMLKRKGGMMA